MAPMARPNSRTGRGYGQIISKFHKPKQQSSQYPYQEEDDVEVEVPDIPIDIQSKIRKIVNSYLANDFLAFSAPCIIKVAFGLSYNSVINSLLLVPAVPLA